MPRRSIDVQRLALSTLLTFLTTSLVASGAALAQGYDTIRPKRQDDFARPGGYISIGAGGAAPLFVGDFEVANDFTSQGILVGLRGGARVNRVFALDVSLDYSAKGFEANFTDGSRIELRSLTGFGNLKLYPFGGRIQPYVMGGVGFVYGVAECFGPGGVEDFCPFLEEDIVFAGRAGGGLDVYITRNVAISAEAAYVIPTGNFSDLNYLSYTGQLLFRF